MTICIGCKDEILDSETSVQDHDFIYHLDCWHFFVERFDLTETPP